MNKFMLITCGMILAITGMYLHVTQTQEISQEPKKELSLAERLAQLRAKLIIKNIESTIGSLQEQAKDIVKSIPGTFDLYKDIKKEEKAIHEIKEEDKDVKEKLTAEKDLRAKVDDKAVNIYAAAPSEYAQLNAKILEIHEDDTIKEMLNKIVELKNKIAEKIREKVVKIQQEGKNINNATKEQQLALKKEILDWQTAQQELEKLVLNDEMNKELDEHRTKILDLKQQLAEKIATLPEQSRVRYRQVQNAIRRLELMLKYIQTPQAIVTATEDEIAHFTE